MSFEMIHFENKDSINLRPFYIYKQLNDLFDLTRFVPTTRACLFCIELSFCITITFLCSLLPNCLVSDLQLSINTSPCFLPGSKFSRFIHLFQSAFTVQFELVYFCVGSDVNTENLLNSNLL